MIYIYTIAIGLYKFYVDNHFLKTINNFFPNEHKNLIIISDGLEKYNNYYFDKCNIKIEHTFNTHGKLIRTNKFNILEDCINRYNNDNDLIFYFDIDTRFIRNKNAEQLMLELLNNDCVYFSRHLHELFWPEWIIHGSNGLHSEDLVNNMPASNSCTYFNVDKTKNEIITSFFFCKKQQFLKMNKYVNELLKIDLNKLLLTPLEDEDYINYIWYLQYTNQIEDKYIDCLNEFFITTNNQYMYDINDENKYYTDNHAHRLIDVNKSKYIFINQKFDNKIKEK